MTMLTILNLKDFAKSLRKANNNHFTHKGIVTLYEHFLETNSYDSANWDENGNMLIDEYTLTEWTQVKNLSKDYQEMVNNFEAPGIKVQGNSYLIREF